jgi:hypothetical protein
MAEIKFKQIAVASSDQNEFVYGLDEDGRVWEGYWKYIAQGTPREFIWEPLPMPKDDRPERTQFP